MNPLNFSESTGVPGKIQVTEAVVQAAKGSFIFESRGKVEVKGKGELETFFLTEKRSNNERNYVSLDGRCPIITPTRTRSSYSQGSFSSCPVSQLRSARTYLESKIKQIDAQISQKKTLEEISDLF